MQKEDLYNIKEALTHAGQFHADDVFSTAFLQIVNPDIKVKRVFAVPEDYNGLVYDIGWGEYDHHQKDRKVRENGIPYAAFGLLWNAFGSLILDEDDVKEFDENFVMGLDLSDNTGSFNPVSEAIGDFNPTWIDNADPDECFWKAVAVAKAILTEKFKQIKANREAYYIVLEQVKACDGPILQLKECIPWKAAVKNTDILYVIYESNRGGYNIQCVRKDGEEDEKKRFPEAWRGKSAEELARITGIQGLRFCHNSGFLCAAETIEDAWKVAQLAVEI